MKYPDKIPKYLPLTTHKKAGHNFKGMLAQILFICWNLFWKMIQMEQKCMDALPSKWCFNYENEAENMKSYFYEASLH